MSISTTTATLHHTQQLKEQIRALAGRLRTNVSLITEPRARSMLETSADVLAGLVKAFDDYEKQNAPAWGDPWESNPPSWQDSEL